MLKFLWSAVCNKTIKILNVYYSVVSMKKVSRLRDTLQTKHNITAQHCDRMSEYGNIKKDASVIFSRHFLTGHMMASKELVPVSKALIYCALCKSKLKKTEKNLFCPKCKSKFKFPLDQSPDEVEKRFQKNMKYCYNCSEKLFVDDDSVLCIDGCELIDFSLGTPEAEEPQERKDEKSISKQKEDKEGIIT